MEKRILILTIGLPRSGKTTWSRKQGLPIVNPDSIRLAIHNQRFLEFIEPLIWAVAKIMVLSLFLAGNNTIILDATNTTKKRRDFWKDDGWEVQFQHIATSEEVCIARATAEGDDEIIPVIKRMAESYDYNQEM
jgi:predicted kinase